MKPFLEGKKASVSSLSPAPAPSGLATLSSLSAPSAKPGLPSPVIEAVKEGDKIIRLVITCSCGERMEVECLYPPGA